MRTMAAAVVLCFFAGLAGAEPPALPPDTKGAPSNMDSFSIVPPKKWTVNVEDAKNRGMYAYFLVGGYTYETSPAIIYIRLMDKMGLRVDEHLQADMNDSRKGNADVSFHPYKIGKMKYTAATRKYRYGKKSCDYLCYVDPGKGEPSYLIFVLTTDYKNCDTYTEDFRAMLESFQWTGMTKQ